MNPLLSLLTLASASHAAVALDSEQQLCNEADVVLVGTVSSTTTRPGSAHFGGILTDAVVTVESIAQGPPLTSVAFTVPGGESGDSFVKVSEWPLLLPGDRWFLVLFTGDSGGLWVVPGYGFQQLSDADPVPPSPQLRQDWNAFCSGG